MSIIDRILASLRNPRPDGASVTLSPLASLSLVIIPAVAISLCVPSGNEKFDSIQYGVSWLAFALLFLAVLMRGNSFSSRVDSILGASVLPFLLLIAICMPWMHPLFVLAGIGVGGAHWLATPDGRRNLSSACIGLLACAAFFAAHKALWWMPWGNTVSTLISKAGFILVVGISIFWVARLERRKEDGKTLYWSWMDILLLLCMAVFIFRINPIMMQPDAAGYHYGAITMSADMARNGGLILHDVPIMYGALNTWLLAILPFKSTLTSLYWTAGICNSLAGFILYYFLCWASPSPTRAWRLMSFALAFAAIALVSGWAPFLSGTLVFPASGAFRFIWLYVMLLMLFVATFKSGKDTGKDLLADRRLIVIGSAIWCLSVLWSCEGAIYVSATWFPACVIMLARPQNDAWRSRIAAFAKAAAKTLAGHSLLLLAMAGTITVLYLCFFGKTPAFSYYWAYSLMVTSGYSFSLPINTSGAVWLLILMQTAFLGLLLPLYPLDKASKRPLMLLCGTWGALWAISSYFIGRSHDNNVTNLMPQIVLSLAVMMHVARQTRRDGRLNAWIWVCIPAVFSVTLWLAAGNPAAVRFQFEKATFGKNVAEIMYYKDSSLDDALDKSFVQKPGPLSIIGGNDADLVLRPELERFAWMPLQHGEFLALYPSRIKYLDRINARFPDGGWLLYSKKPRARDWKWFFDYAKERFEIVQYYENTGWWVFYLTPKNKTAARQPQAGNASPS